MQATKWGAVRQQAKRRAPGHRADRHSAAAYLGLVVSVAIVIGAVLYMVGYAGRMTGDVTSRPAQARLPMTTGQGDLLR